MTLKRMMQTLIVALLVAGPAGAEESDYLVEAWKPSGYWRVQGGWSYPDDSDLPDSVLGNSSLSDTGTVGFAVGVHGSSCTAQE